MRQWTIPILGVVALSLAVPATADARPRFGPAALFGAFAGVLGGFRPAISQRSYRARTARRPPARSTGGEARVERAARVERPVASLAHVGWIGPVFWPSASDDMFAYALFPSGADNKFWTYGYSHILQGVFAGSGERSRAVAATANNNSGADPEAKELSAAAVLCGSARAPDSADGVIERIERALQPSAAQRQVLEPLRTALAEAGERIKVACRSTMPLTPTQRLDAMQDRIWAMRDATLTMRIPLENFYASLTDDQKARLSGGAPRRSATGAEAGTTDGRAGAAAPRCADRAAGLADWPTRAIDRVLRPSEQQRASLEALRMRLGAMAQLIMSSCPTETSASPLGRLASAMDRLDVMLFALMSLGPAVQEFYDSLSDKQKADLHKVIRQQRRAGGDS